MRNITMNNTRFWHSWNADVWSLESSWLRHMCNANTHAFVNMMGIPSKLHISLFLHLASKCYFVPSCIIMWKFISCIVKNAPFSFSGINLATMKILSSVTGLDLTKNISYLHFCTGRALFVHFKVFLITYKKSLCIFFCNVINSYSNILQDFFGD